MDLAGLYRDIVETSPDGIWVIDLDGRTLYANPAIARMYGVTPSELSGLTVFDTLDDLGKRQFAAHLADLRAGRVNEAEVEVRFVRRDGSSAWVLVRESLLRAADGTVTGILHRSSDYGHRRQVLDELRLSRERLAEAHRIARIGSWDWDLDTDEIHGSPELVELYGMDPASFPISYAQFLRIVHQEDRAAVDAVVRQALAGADEFDFLARVNAHGDWMWTRGRGVVHREPSGRVWLSGTHQDVTEARRTEQALRDQVSQNTLMRAVASAANEATSLVEALRHARSLVLLQDDWRRARAFVPDGQRDTVHPLQLDEAEQPVGAGGPEETDAELALARRAFRARHAVWDERVPSIACPVLVDGEVCAVVTITSDSPLHRHDVVRSMLEQVAVQLGTVAERERAQRELADARDQAMEASRLKSEFLATMTHEIRTPLNGVIGLNDLLLRTDLTPEQLRLASGAQVAGRALLDALNDVLDLSKIEAGQLHLEAVDLDVRALLDQVSSVLSQVARGKGLALVATCHPEVPPALTGDPTRLAQVLTNLVANAVKFTERGHVLVDVAAEAGDDGGTVLRVQVADTGVGVPEGQSERLFEPFTQGDASTTRLYGGTGLGLAISRRIVEAMGGELRYAPNPGGGSVFGFTARLGTPRTGAVRAGEERARAALGGRRALVVDEEPQARLALEQRLGRWGLRASGVGTPLEGLRAMRRAAAEGDPFDAVLLGHGVPAREAEALASDVRREPELGARALLLGSPEAPASPDGLRDALLRHLAGAGPSAGPSAPAGPGGGMRRRVLVVEDNPVNQMVALGLLESMGYAARAVDDGVAALELLAQEAFDAVLMDVQMPRMDGYTTTRRIREREADGVHVPVVAMTATAVEGERERCLGAGMDEFLTKPVDPTALAGVLARWFAAPPPPPVDVLDRGRLDMLRELEQGDTGYLDRAIGTFLERAGAGLQAIREAVDAEDPAAARSAAHRLAGGALNLGARAVAEAARRVEALGEAGTCEGARDLLPPLEAELGRARAALVAYRSSYGA